MQNRNIKKVVVKKSLKGQESDLAYWQTRSFEERLAALEEMRQEYNNWKYTDAEQRFQRVYRVTQLKRG